MSKPSKEALRLAGILNDHQLVCPCAECIDAALTIDKELLLPEKHAALLLAQAVVDELDRWTTSTDGIVSAINDLREALSRIKCG